MANAAENATAPETNATTTAAAPAEKPNTAPAVEPSTDQKLRSMFGTPPAEEANAPKSRRRAAKEIPTGEETSPETPEKKPEVTKPAEKPVEATKGKKPAAQPVIDSATLRRAKNHGIDVSEYGTDVAGLKRTLVHLDRVVAERTLEAGETPAPKKTEPQVPTRKSLADKFKELGHDEGTIDAIRDWERERDEEARKERDELASLRGTLEKTAKSEADRRQAKLYADYESAVSKLDPDLYGSGEPEELSDEAFEARQVLFPHVMRIGRSYAASEMEMPDFDDIVAEAHRAVNRERYDDGVRKSHAKQFNARKGTQQQPPAPKDATKPAQKKTGEAAAIEELNELIETTPEYKASGWTTG